MAKAKPVYTCNECGAQTPQWIGRCPSCDAWNTLIETAAVANSKTSSAVARYGNIGSPLETQSLDSIAPDQISRFSSGLSELDRVLGGGLVPGSVVLLGGDPGIGKSTLLLQALSVLGRHHRSLYVTGEESSEQIALRAHRLGLKSEGLRILSENQVENILLCCKNDQPQIVVIDSIQTVFTELLQSAPGSVAQVRESAAQFVRMAKKSSMALILVGHVTKEGTLAGPRVLEHMVDTVLYFEGDPSNSYRIIRAIKNRFGAINEIGVFAMTELGLREVNNPSAMFLSRQGNAVAGSVVLATQEGTRPLLVEVQALVDESHLSSPRRVCVGLDSNRLAMLLAVLHRHGSVVTYDQDVFMNVVGGVRVLDTASDLAVVAATVSSLLGKPLGNDLVIFGEVGLGGEVRPVQRGQDRIREAEKLGFKRAVIPAANQPKNKECALKLYPVRRLTDVLELLS